MKNSPRIYDLLGMMYNELNKHSLVSDTIRKEYSGVTSCYSESLMKELDDIAHIRSIQKEDE